jgi:hypothetical protein
MKDADAPCEVCGLIERHTDDCVIGKLLVALAEERAAVAEHKAARDKLEAVLGEISDDDWDTISILSEWKKRRDAALARVKKRTSKKAPR